jgi:hypothetical protein
VVEKVCGAPAHKARCNNFTYKHRMHTVASVSWSGSRFGVAPSVLVQDWINICLVEDAEIRLILWKDGVVCPGYYCGVYGYLGRQSVRLSDSGQKKQQRMQ